MDDRPSLGQRLKIVSFNIHKGFSSAGLNFTLTAIREEIRALGVEIVFLQEVLGAHKRHSKRIKDWPSQPQFEYLADQVWSHYAYGQNSVYSSGHHGNAILSAFPIVSTSNINISTNVVEKRGLLHAKLELPSTGHFFHCFSVHLSLFQSGRDRQINDISDWILREVGSSEPFILAGDFNDWRHRATDRLAANLRVEEVHHFVKGHPAKTFPARFPLLSLDRVYVRGLKVKDAQVLREQRWQSLSDHLALYAELEI